MLEFCVTFGLATCFRWLTALHCATSQRADSNKSGADLKDACKRAHLFNVQSHCNYHEMHALCSSLPHPPTEPLQILDRHLLTTLPPTFCRPFCILANYCYRWKNVSWPAEFTSVCVWGCKITLWLCLIQINVVIVFSVLMKTWWNWVRMTTWPHDKELMKEWDKPSNCLEPCRSTNRALWAE